MKKEDCLPSKNLCAPLSNQNFDILPSYLDTILYEKHLKMAHYKKNEPKKLWGFEAGNAILYLPRKQKSLNGIENTENYS